MLPGILADAKNDLEGSFHTIAMHLWKMLEPEGGALLTTSWRFATQIPEVWQFLCVNVLSVWKSPFPCRMFSMFFDFFGVFLFECPLHHMRIVWTLCFEPLVYSVFDSCLVWFVWGEPNVQHFNNEAKICGTWITWWRVWFGYWKR